jgi:hypothetical protein
MNLAFDQITLLVTHGFKVLQPTRNITYIVAAIRVLTVIFLRLILIILPDLINTVSSDLEHERLTLVTPLVKYLANSAVQCGRWLQVGAWAVMFKCVVGTAGGLYVTRDVTESVEVEGPKEKAKPGERADV